MSPDDGTGRTRGPVRIYVHVSVGGPAVPPTRFEVVVCDRCSALVPAAGSHRHRHYQHHYSADERTKS